MNALLIGLVLAATPQTDTSTPGAPRISEQAPTPTPTRNASAEDESASSSPAFRSHIDLSLHFGWFVSGNIDGVAINPMASGFFVLQDHLAISGEIGGSVFTNDGDGLDTGTSNLFIAAHYLRALNRENSVRLGLGLGVPLAGSSRFTVASILSASARGNWDLWMYLPSTTIVFPGRYEYRTDHFGAAVDLALALYFILGEDEPDFGIQFGPEAFATFSGLDLGLRFRVASIPTIETDATQLALSPFARLEAGMFRATLALSFLLDEPLGPSFSDNSAFATELSVGLAL